MDTKVTNETTGRFNSGDVGIFYRLFGKPGKMPLAIVHGLSFFSYDWIEPARGLAGDRQIAAMDMRGFGELDWAKDYSIPTNAGDIMGLLDHLAWPKAVLMGHSMGGRHCTYATAKNPDRVAALVLVDWSPQNAPAGAQRVTETVGRTPDTFASIDEAMRYFGVDPDTAQGKTTRPRFEAYLKAVPGGFAVKRDRYFHELFKRVLETGEKPKRGVDMWEMLGEVRCPTLVIRGNRSDMFAAETVDKVKATNPNIRLVEVDAGHNVAGDNLKGLLEHVHAFLAEQGV